jgi:DNA processing protein
VAELFATELAQRGVTIVSGLARGIDAIAHESALRAGGQTVAVLGCGIDVDYPPRNARLQQRIAEQGLLVSEFAPGSTAFARNFPRRNRIIALLSQAVLVIEAGVKSGTLKTVEWAMGYNVEVFAVPGPIGRSESQGTNEIIRDGGRIALSTRDVFEVMQWGYGDAGDVGGCGDVSANDDAHAVSGDPAVRTVYSKLSLTPAHVDSIARRAGVAVPEALIHLMQLELAGVVVQHAGKRFARAGLAR